MSGRNLVVQSINNADASRCVDIFRRADGTFGYAEFRRDIEDGRGWFRIGPPTDDFYAEASQALAAAAALVLWLPDTLSPDA